MHLMISQFYRWEMTQNLADYAKDGSMLYFLRNDIVEDSDETEYII